MNPARDVDPGCGAPKIVTAVVEIPKGSKNKYEVDEETGMLRLDRVLSSAVRYPANYGFIPRTRGEDGEPLDVVVLGQGEVPPLTLMAVKPIGVLYVRSAGAVDAGDPQYRGFETAESLPPHLLVEVQNFFEIYKTLEGKPGSIEGFEGAPEARALIKRALKAYHPRAARRAWRH